MFCGMVLDKNRLVRVEKRVSILVFCELCLDQTFNEFGDEGWVGYWILEKEREREERESQIRPFQNKCYMRVLGVSYK